MKIWFISDTHGRHRELKVPECDYAIHCGDEANSPQPHLNERESRDFFTWANSLPFPMLFTPGNHSVAYARGLIATGNVLRLVDLSHSIRDSASEGKEYKVYGSPWTPSFRSQHWVYIRDRSKMRDVWELIPKCDILVTHGPPKGILDIADNVEGSGLAHCGCRSLLRRVLEIRPKVHAFGHVHSGKDHHNSGIYQNYGITFINCSVVDNDYNLVNDGFLYEIS